MFSDFVVYLMGNMEGFGVKNCMVKLVMVVVFVMVL